MISYTQAINLALLDFFKVNSNSIFIGLGANDPKRIFGTTSQLIETFGASRIIDPPTSENSFTGIALGLAVAGHPVCLTHQRFDFALLSFDQIINSIAKWKFMFGNDDIAIPILIRLIVGRGWGQGPTHSQSYHSFLSSIPGLTVLYPTTCQLAYDSVISGLSSGDPTLLIEHRWLHNTQTESLSRYPDSVSCIPRITQNSNGTSLTILTYGYMSSVVIKAISYFEGLGFSFNVFTINKISSEFSSDFISTLTFTDKLLIIDSYMFSSSFLHSLSTHLLSTKSCSYEYFKFMSLPDLSESTSYFQTKSRYISLLDVVTEISEALSTDIAFEGDPLLYPLHHDIPGNWFRGPF